MKKVIFYGAGAHAAKILGSNPAIEIIPTPPPLESGVCFIDENSDKWGSAYLGLPVMSIDEGLSKYKDAEIYITLADFETVCSVDTMLMRKGVYDYRIKSIFPPLLRTSCIFLQNFVICGYHERAFNGKAGDDLGCHALKSCFSDYGRNNVAAVPIGNSLEESFKEFLALRDDTIRKLNIGEPTECDGCIELKSLYRTENTIFTYITYNELGVCNCKCTYCNHEERIGRDTNTDADFIELLRLVKSFGFDDENGVISLCNGEITIHPKRNDFYEAVKHNRVMFLTNGLIFDDFIDLKLKDGTGILNVSIDSGTSNTFKMIKGVDAFHKVTANLLRYAEKCRGIINLKYIVLPGVNDNHDDIDGFVRLCVRLNVTSAHISHNLCLSYEDYDNHQTKNAFLYLIEQLNKNGIVFEVYLRDIFDKTM